MDSQATSHETPVDNTLKRNWLSVPSMMIEIKGLPESHGYFPASTTNIMEMEALDSKSWLETAGFLLGSFFQSTGSWQALASFGNSTSRSSERALKS